MKLRVSDDFIASTIVGAIIAVTTFLTVKYGNVETARQDDNPYYIPSGGTGRTFRSLYGTDDPNTKVIKNICEGAKAASFDSDREEAARNIYRIARKSPYASSTNAAIDALEELAIKCSFSSSRNKIRKYEQMLLTEED